MPVVELSGAPAWLQVVHDLNVSNRVHGRRVAADNYAVKFGQLIAEVVAPKRRELIVEMAWKTPGRVAKETGRSVVKQAILRAVGKNGLDRLKTGLVFRR